MQIEPAEHDGAIYLLGWNGIFELNAIVMIKLMFENFKDYKP